MLFTCAMTNCWFSEEMVGRNNCWFSEVNKEIIYLVSSLQNLWSSALIIQNRLLRNIMKRRTDRHQVLKLMLCDKVISRERKKVSKIKAIILDSPWTYKTMVSSISQRWSGSWWLERKFSNVKAIVACLMWRKNTTRFQKPIYVEMQVAVKVYYLSDEGWFRKTANVFGIAISNNLADRYIKLARTEEEVKESCSLFSEKHGFPQCLVAVDGTHIAI